MDPVDLVFPNARTVPEIQEESPENRTGFEREAGATALYFGSRPRERAGARMFPDLTADDIFRIETERLWLRWPRASDALAITSFVSLA
jgi:hypothetical protein